MAIFKQIEDIKAWQKARELAREVYALSNQGMLRKDFGLRDQMRRASVSIASNIAEGHDRDGTAEFNHFLSIAKGSAGELKTQLYIAADQNYIDQETFKRLMVLIDLTSKMIASLMIYLRDCSLKGIKFK